MRRVTRGALPVALVPLIALSACATQPPEDDNRISVVASTNVYGSMVSTIAGDLVSVASIITREAQDPHSYEASARDQLAISHADLVISNGGGYDPFMDTLLRASGNTDAIVVTALDVVGLTGDATDEDADTDAREDTHTDAREDTHAVARDDAHIDAREEADTDQADEHADEHTESDPHADHDHSLNEHLWYDFAAMEQLAAAIGDALAAVDPANADTYTANAESFAESIGILHTRAHDLRAGWAGTPVAVTEPVPLYLLEDVGLVNRTPADFTEAIEEGSDVPPLVLQETLEIVRSGIALLAVNAQTTSPETEELWAAAELAGVAIVSFTETLPADRDYLSWMSDNLAALETVLI